MFEFSLEKFDLNFEPVKFMFEIFNLLENKKQGRQNILYIHNRNRSFLIDLCQ